MPWCDTCDEYRAPTALNGEGHCVVCDAAVDSSDVTEQKKTAEKVPWHFTLMVVALIGYLGWRLVDGVLWIVGRF